MLTRNFVKYARGLETSGPRSHRDIIAGNVVGLPFESGSTRRWKCLWNSMAPLLSGAHARALCHVPGIGGIGKDVITVKELDHQAGATSNWFGSRGFCSRDSTAPLVGGSSCRDC